MADKPPMTWDAEGKLVPLAETELQRQREIIAKENPFDPDTPRFRVMTKAEMRRERAARMVRACEGVLQLKFEPPFEFIGGPRSAVLVLLITIVFIVGFVFFVIAALIWLPFAKARLRKIDAEMREQPTGAGARDLDVPLRNVPQDSNHG